MVGNGAKALFWEDQWVNGARISEVAPSLYARIPSRIRRKKVVKDALANDSWAMDIGPNLTMEELQEFLNLWMQLERVELADEVEDMVKWAWESKGIYSSKSAYEARFMGREVSSTAAFTWKSKAPFRCRFFSWLAIRNRHWTSDRLARRGLPHQDACPFCSQHEETMQHLLIDYALARQVWHWCTTLKGWMDYNPLPGETLVSWCEGQDASVLHCKSTRAICMLGMWTL
ncbi:uncharacterized protein [Aegilops tauschii subsp. strangulata]|uniref:uncharacterized protein n=1 Tax=Aegilops tauschii subsp. strangulata TaxID=200361 RepID=UPI003CC8D5F4